MQDDRVDDVVEQERLKEGVGKLGMGCKEGARAVGVVEDERLRMVR